MSAAHKSRFVQDSSIKLPCVSYILLKERTCTHTHTHTHIYIYIYICVCVCILTLTKNMELAYIEEVQLCCYYYYYYYYLAANKQITNQTPPQNYQLYLLKNSYYDQDISLFKNCAGSFQMRHFIFIALVKWRLLSWVLGNEK